LQSSWPEGASNSGEAARPEGAAATTSGAAARVGTTWNSSTTSGAVVRPEGAAARVGDDLDDERSSSAPGGPPSCPRFTVYWSGRGRPAGARALARAQLRHVPSELQREPSACPSLISNLGPRWRRNVSERGFLQKFYLMGWATGGPSNSGRRE
jgi:hypothetical protein